MMPNCSGGCTSSRYTIQRSTIQRCTIHAQVMQTCLLYVEIIHNIKGRKNNRNMQRPGFLGAENF